MNVRQVVLILLVCVGFMSCGSKGETNKAIKDLAFNQAETPKEYADIILRALRTNRDKVIYNEIANKAQVESRALNLMVQAYSQSIGNKRDKWEFVDYYAEHKEQPKEGAGYDYTWYDRKGRIAIQVNILPSGEKYNYTLEKIEFRSRIDILESEAFPGGSIEDYKKLASKSN